jgi:hypothetical protein
MFKHTLKSLVLLTLISGLSILFLTAKSPTTAQASDMTSSTTGTPDVVELLPAAGELMEDELTLVGTDLLQGKPVVQMMPPGMPPVLLPFMDAGVRPLDDPLYPGMDFVTVGVDPALWAFDGTYTLMFMNDAGTDFFTFDIIVECSDCKPGRSRRGQ